MSENLEKLFMEKYEVILRSGLFLHKRNGWNFRKGELAGCARPDGYVSVALNNKSYLSHRIIFLIANGRMPEYIDHINGDKSDNRMENLREVTPHINSCNVAMKQKNKYGATGVRYRKSRDAFEAFWQEGERRKQRYFSCKKYGGYKSARDEAIKCRSDAINRINLNGGHYTDRHGKPEA